MREGIPIIGILRGFSKEVLHGIVPAAIKGGLAFLEVTMNSPAAEEQIRIAIQLSEGRVQIGAGTVTSAKLLDLALDAGATFIVTPVTDEELMKQCAERKVPFYPGAYSPTEVCRAWEAGASMVKIFPAEFGGAAYIRALKGVFPAIKLLPTGGVDLQTVGEFVRADASGIGLGSQLFNRARIEARDWAWIEKRCAAFVQAVGAAE